MGSYVSETNKQTNKQQQQKASIIKLSKRLRETYDFGRSSEELEDPKPRRESYDAYFRSKDRVESLVRNSKINSYTSSSKIRIFENIRKRRKTALNTNMKLTLSLLKVIKVNVLPSNSTHRYEVHKGEHGILYFAQTIADVAISSHNITHTFPI